MGFIDAIVSLLRDPRSAIAAAIAAGPFAAYGFVFLIIFIETGVVFFRFCQVIHFCLHPASLPTMVGFLFLS